jgi:DNA replication protein DnaC
MSNLDALADKTFETFSLDLPGLSREQLNDLQSGYQQAHDYAAHPEGWLLLQGSYGSGKTHLAAAVANHRLVLGEQVLFVTTPDLLDHLRSAFGPASELDYDELFERVRTAPLLVLDDLGAESPTPWAQEKLYQLINHRYQTRLATVFTTNTDVSALDPRIGSRLGDVQLTKSVFLRLPDFRRGSGFVHDKSVLSNLDHLYADMTFETFELRQNRLPENEFANLVKTYEKALSFAKAPQGWMLFMGENGCGKTHLAAAIANYRRNLGETVLFVTIPDLLDYLRAAFTAPASISFEKRIYEIRTAPLLVIDQLDLTNASPWAREKLRQIVDYRYLSRAPTVFTTTQQIEEIDPALRSRLLDTRFCQLLTILAHDYRGGESEPRRRRELKK